MKRKRFAARALFAVCAVCIILVLVVPLSGKPSSEAAAPLGRTTILVAGLDDAVDNTDVLMLLSVDNGSQEITVLQIPRDTYFCADTAQNKINQIYPCARARGKSSEEALGILMASVSQAFGVPIDYYMAFRLSTVIEVIDEIGGVELDIPTAIRHRNPYGEGYIEIPAGHQTLVGREAVEFLRFRAGYVDGDLGRMDAQKLLLGSLYRKMKNEMSLSFAINLIPKLYHKLSTDMPIKEQLTLARNFYDRSGGYKISFLTLPGEATRGDVSQGVWYYVVNKAASEKALARYFGASGIGDETRLCDPSRVHFENIYYDENRSYTVYTEDTVEDVTIKTKKK